mmetsp:Transcript_5270/g.8300  ORF Transcript_5270/g.8300 Transcript_5270/m.8300 type:complete len:228 (-) Transcript_5270:281-964(-)
MPSFQSLLGAQCTETSHHHILFTLLLFILIVLYILLLLELCHALFEPVAPTAFLFFGILVIIPLLFLSLLLAVATLLLVGSTLDLGSTLNLFLKRRNILLRNSPILLLWNIIALHAILLVNLITLHTILRVVTSRLSTLIIIIIIIVLRIMKIPNLHHPHLRKHPLVNIRIKVIESRKTHNEINTIKSTSPNIRHSPILKRIIRKARYSQRLHKRRKVAQKQDCKPK